MIVTLPSNLETSLSDRSKRLNRSVEELVQEAVAWYMQIDPDLLDELDGWQHLRDEAWHTVEESLS